MMMMTVLSKPGVGGLELALAENDGFLKCFTLLIQGDNRINVLLKYAFWAWLLPYFMSRKIYVHHVTGKEWCNFDLFPSVGVYNNIFGTRAVT